MPRLSTHVLDTAAGRPASGVALALFRIEPSGGRTLLVKARTNADGRTDEPLLAGDEFRVGHYEIEFHIGDYFRAQGAAVPDPPFFDVVPLRFGLADPQGHYHAPLLVSPWSYSTYRGS